MKKSLKLKHTLLPIIVIFLSPCLISNRHAFAEDIPPVAEIVAKANLAAYYAGNDGKAKVIMKIKDPQGIERIRHLTILRRDVTDGGEQKFYVYFQKPADVRKMVFMVHKKISADDDRWLYLPGLDLVKRIAGSDKRTSFAGSHFVYEDVSGRGVEEDTHELIETTKTHFVVKNIPKDPASVEFSYYIVTIDRTNYMPLKGEYFDKNGTKYRVVEALEIKYINGFPTVIKSRAKDVLSGGETTVEFKEVQYNISLKDSIFTERYLRRPPREVRR